MRPTWAEISLGSFRENLNEVRRLVGENVRIMAVVKANAYGHGAIRISKVAIECGEDILGVATVAEAIELREAGIKSEIFLLGGVDPTEADLVVENGLTPACYSTAVLRALSSAAVKKKKILPYHLKLNTGMTRIGICPRDVMSFSASAVKLPHIFMEGVFTHLACSEDKKSDYTDFQLEVFNQTLSVLSQHGQKWRYAHAANSASLQRFPNSHMDMVRPGIMLYGSGIRCCSLSPVMSLKTKIVQLRKVPTGTPVGYGGSFVTQRETLVATLPIGYADGYPVALSNKAKVSVRKMVVPVIGSVCMDFIMVDVTDVSDVCLGDEVTLFGDSLISVDDVSLWAQTISYEIMSRISRRVPRVYV